MKIRRQLEQMFRDLGYIHSALMVCCEAYQLEHNFSAEIADILRTGGTNEIFRIRKTLTRMIERLGGTTEMSEGRQSETRAPQPTTEDNGDDQSPDDTRAPPPAPDLSLTDRLEAERERLFKALSIIECARLATASLHEHCTTRLPITDALQAAHDFIRDAASGLGVICDEVQTLRSQE
jgi:hypothetical protein